VQESREQGIRGIREQASSSDAPRWRRALRNAGCTVFALALIAIASASPGRADDYDKKSSGHPLRIIAYVLHPVGVAIDFLVLRPAHWLGSREPLKTIFGHED
jgi:hypothetical protein